jgi:hypothetical protein
MAYIQCDAVLEIDGRSIQCKHRKNHKHRPHEREITMYYAWDKNGIVPEGYRIPPEGPNI